MTASAFSRKANKQVRVFGLKKETKISVEGQLVGAPTGPHPFEPAAH